MGIAFCNVLLYAGDSRNEHNIDNCNEPYKMSWMCEESGGIVDYIDTGGCSGATDDNTKESSGNVENTDWCSAGLRNLLQPGSEEMERE